MTFARWSPSVASILRGVTSVPMLAYRDTIQIRQIYLDPALILTNVVLMQRPIIPAL